MQYKVISAGSPQGLTEKVQELISEGWKPVGSHSVVTERSINRYAGQQHMDTRHEIEYAQTMVKDDEPIKALDPMISELDVKTVADDLNKIVSQDCINYVRENYASAVSENPTEVWNLIVENLIYQYQRLYLD